MHSSEILGEYLRFCPECYAEEIRKYGESYWHRIHQTPGVLVCAKHNCQLIESNISTMSNRQGYYLPMGSTYLHSTKQRPKYSISNQKILSQVASDVEFLYLKTTSIREQFLFRNCSFRQAYMASLQKKGIATATGSIRIEKFKTAFCEYFNPELLNLLGIPIKNVEKWTVSLCRNETPPQKALKYILLAEFVVGSFREFIEHLDKIENDLCRAVVYKRPITTNYKEAAPRYRSRWLAAKEQLPLDASKTEIKNKDKAAYAWLYRNDKDWLNENSPKYKPNNVYTRHTIWQKRDKDYADMVPAAVEVLLAKSSLPERLTCASISREMDCSGVMKAKAAFFPLTMAQIDKYKESIHQYHLRKINWVRNEMNRNGEILAPWVIVSRAGIKSKESKKYIEMLKQKDSHVDTLG